MKIRRLEPSDRPQAEAMWIEIFEEGAAFAKYYFDRRFHSEHSFGAFDGDRLVAMAQGRPTEIFVEGKILRAMLVAGVSTLPAYRNRGLMHKLMSMLIDHARKEGFSCYLHPVSETLYASLGFRNGTDALIIRSDTNRGQKAYTLSDAFIVNDLLSVYDTFQKTHDGMQIRDEEELLTVFEDYAIDGAKTLIAYDEKRPVGYISCGPDGLVYELLALCTSVYEALLDEAARRIGKEIKAIAPVDCGIEGERRYSMQYLVFDDAFRFPLNNGFCRLAY